MTWSCIADSGDGVQSRSLLSWFLQLGGDLVLLQNWFQSFVVRGLCRQKHLLLPVDPPSPLCCFRWLTTVVSRHDRGCEVDPNKPVCSFTECLLGKILSHKINTNETLFPEVKNRQRPPRSPDGQTPAEKRDSDFTFFNYLCRHNKRSTIREQNLSLCAVTYSF